VAVDAAVLDCAWGGEYREGLSLLTYTASKALSLLVYTASEERAAAPDGRFGGERLPCRGAGARLTDQWRCMYLCLPYVFVRMYLCLVVSCRGAGARLADQWW
jgi:hypothetical protein